MQAINRCGPLLHMSHIVWSVLGTLVSCAKTAELILSPFWGLTHVGLRMGYRSPHESGLFQRVTRRCGLLPNYVRHLLIVFICK